MAPFASMPSFEILKKIQIYEKAREKTVSFLRFLPI
jgi:hypothetical protein